MDAPPAASERVAGMAAVLALTALCATDLAAAGPTPSATSSGKLLFLDYDSIEDALTNASIELRTHQPQRALLENGGRVIWQEHPWENYAIFAYGSAMRAADGQMRIYYGCDSGASQKPPLERTYQHTCVAVSDDGVSWTKPKLRLIKDPLTGTLDNNLVWPPNYMDPDNPCSNCHPGPNGAGVPCPCPFTHMAFHETGTVFVDTRPGVPPSQLYKMVANAQHPKHKDKTGTYALASPDGFGNWTFMSELPALAGSDTCNVGWWDEKYGEYVFYVRWDGAPCQDYTNKTCHPGMPGRSVARVATKDLSKPWGPRKLTGISLTDKLHATYDVYTNMATRYEGYYVFFPSIYWHFSTKAVNGLPNDGLWDTRLAVSSAGLNITAPGGVKRLARYGNSQWVQHGVNTCPAKPNALPSDKGKSFAETAWDTSMTAVLSGYFLSPTGHEMYLYKWGSSMTHEGGHQQAAWSAPGEIPNTGIELMTLRRDGFVSADAPLYEYPGFGHSGSQDVRYPKLEELPTVTTAIPLLVPTSCPAKAALFVNVQTSMVGSAHFELRVSGRLAADGTVRDRDGSSYSPVDGFTLAESDFLKGNYIARAVSWGGGKRTHLPATLAAHNVSVRVAMNDASLYSLEVRCDEA